MSSTKILQPSCSPKKLTLLPTTGPRSSSTGDSREVSVAQELVQGFGGEDGIVGAGRRPVLRTDVRLAFAGCEAV